MRYCLTAFLKMEWNAWVLYEVGGLFHVYGPWYSMLFCLIKVRHEGNTKDTVELRVE